MNEIRDPKMIEKIMKKKQEKSDKENALCWFLICVVPPLIMAIGLFFWLKDKF